MQNGGPQMSLPSFRFFVPGENHPKMRMYPRSGFRSGGTSECTLVPVFVPGEHPPKPPFLKTTLLRSPKIGACLILSEVIFTLKDPLKTAPQRPLL